MISREKFKVYGNVFDQYTLRNLFKLSSQEHYEELKSPIKVGKEANVFSAQKKDGSLVVVKIYRLQSCNFNNMYYYISPDPRYQSLRKQRRKVIFSWTQREFRNLYAARKAGVRVPTPYAFLDNIIVMEHIGDNQPAPQLKDSIPENPEKFFDKTIEYMRKLHKAKLVHGDLSHFNILNFRENPVFIDFSQSTTLAHPEANNYLIRDIENICKFFKKLGVKANPEEVEQQIKKK